jgi:HEAT repeat protein
LNDPHINVAIAAGEALGKLGSPEAVPHLIRALQYPDSWMRCIAAEALGKIGDARAVDAFLEISYDDEPIVLYTMIKAMGNLRDIRVLPYILSLLKLNAKFASSVIQAIEQLLEFCGNEVYEVIKQADVGMNFVQVLSTESLDVLLSAIRLIGKLQYKEAVPSLKRLLCHADKMVVTESISALKQIEGPAYIRPMLEQALGETTHPQGKHILQRALNEFENSDILS